MGQGLLTTSFVPSHLGETPLGSPGLGEGYSEKALTQDTQTLKAVAATAQVPPANFQ